MANPEHVERLKQGVEVWNAWRREHPDTRPDLSRANLKFANLSHADLSSAGLSGADLSYADLGRADLSGADLFEARLSRARLGGTNFTGAHFWDTIFVQIDLSNAQGLDGAFHLGPSTVNITSVTLPSDEPTRLHFLRGVGFTETQIEYLPSLLTPRPIQYSSLFISYAHQDEAIAQRLYTDLRKKDVPCWMAPHDLRPGDYHHSRIDEAIHLHEKTLLLLSEHAVNSSWVKHEVQIALAREVAQDCTVLFPLCLDEAVMHTSKDWAARLRESRHFGDFTSWQDETFYQQAFDTLLRHLEIARQ